MCIEKAYELLKQVPHTMIDSFAVVKQVEEYRQFWKPKEIKIVLLAESHVYTDEQDSEVKYKRLAINEIIPNYPQHFVRFVYCLGYGENEILERTIKKNMGTPQFWKIFSSCVAESANNEALGFHKVLKTQTPNFEQRLKNKVNILRKMQEKGIWLLDASIVGIYRSGIKNQKTIKRIIEICWKNHIANVINESQPKHIIVIGKRVENILNLELEKLKNITVIPQPNARLSRQEQLKNYKKYQSICAKIC